MNGRRKTLSLELTDHQRAELLRWQRSSALPAGLVRRGRLILMLGAGRSVTEAATIAGLAPNHARKWVHRFLDQGTAGLKDQPGRGRKRNKGKPNPAKPRNRPAVQRSNRLLVEMQTAGVGKGNEFFSHCLRALRRKAKWTRRELAARCHLHRDTIKRLESGTYQPAYDTLLRLADVFGVSLSAFAPPKDSQANRRTAAARSTP